MTKIMKCGCRGWKDKTEAAKFQDKQYGEGMRVHNAVSKENTFRCTICGDEHGSSK